MSALESFKKKKASLLLSPMDQDRRTGMVFLIVSIVAHGLFFGFLIFFQDFHFARSMPPVIQIDLVSFSPVLGSDKPGGAGGQEIEGSKEEIQSENKEAGPPVQPAEVKKEEPPPVIKADISLKTKPKNLKDLLAEQEKKNKEEEKKKEEKIDKKPPQPETDASKTTAKSNDKADENNMSEILGRLRKKVAEQGKSRQGDGGAGEGKGGSPEGTGKGGSTPLQIYLMEIGSRIQQNWVFNESLARMDRNLEVRIIIKILKSGEIRDIIFETRSGNPYLDESAKKAILKINPLKPLPAGMYSYDLGLIFTPQGLK
jgi:outer membrane biosynthesis protein TonB